MITSSVADYLVDEVSGSTHQNRATGEYFPAMEEAGSAKQQARSTARRNRFRSGWKAILGVPNFVVSQAARLVPASVKAALSGRAEADVLAINIRRLEGISPHLLDDIGIEQVARDVYVMKTDETVAEAATPEPAVTAFQPEPAAPTANPAPQRVRRPSVRQGPTALAGAV